MLEILLIILLCSFFFAAGVYFATRQGPPLIHPIPLFLLLWLCAVIVMMCKPSSLTGESVNRISVTTDYYIGEDISLKFDSPTKLDIITTHAFSYLMSDRYKIKIGNSSSTILLEVN